MEEVPIQVWQTGTGEGDACADDAAEVAEVLKDEMTATVEVPLAPTATVTAVVGAADAQTQNDGGQLPRAQLLTHLTHRKKTAAAVAAAGACVDAVAIVAELLRDELPPSEAGAAVVVLVARVEVADKEDVTALIALTGVDIVDESEMTVGALAALVDKTDVEAAVVVALTGVDTVDGMEATVVALEARVVALAGVDTVHEREAIVVGLVGRVEAVDEEAVAVALAGVVALAE
ncbi:hypothetical protein BDZ88DRAFT_455612 [Geranomyces variabilis]|nr:hypothetical protein BDZ88DRAFT_455612 [Geranomyces variabilis]KAJ3132718.1 hypothetical protein HDU90_006770 [Geranomyces variabilis]